MPGRLEGKTAFITGAAQGMGRCHAIRFAREGADLILIDLNDPSDVDVPYQTGSLEALEETAQLVEQAGGRAFVRAADIRDREALKRVYDESADEFPRLDVIVANAGIAGHGRFLELTQWDWQQMIDINLTGAFNTVQTFLPRMLAGGNGGSIIIVSSVAGTKGLPYFAAYCSAKHGLQGLMAVIAQEFSEHAIRVNTINPGPIATPMNLNDMILSLFTDDKTMEIFQKSFSPMLPLPEIGFIDPDHVTDAVTWLASDEAKYVTGLAIPVDAGVMGR
jgi:SDR family mycofactocin-dependent oxidoreductase